MASQVGPDWVGPDSPLKIIEYGPHKQPKQRKYLKKSYYHFGINLGWFHELQHSKIYIFQ